MISALRRKLGGDKDSSTGQVMPSGVHRVDQQLQKKYARGVQYNMKIVIRGDRNVGKSCLMRRLQGLPFLEEYVATEEIQVVSIHWNYRATDDVVKVDVWDIVDQSTKKRVRNDRLKLSNAAAAASAADEQWEDAACDARFVDVYKGSHGAILMFDLTKQWTWDYVQREMEKVPEHIPVLILANRRDMGHHRNVTDEMCRSYVEEFNIWRLRAIRSFSPHSTQLIFRGWPWLAMSLHSECMHWQLFSGQILWGMGSVRAKGWIVRTSRRAHRVLLSLALAISAMTVVQSTTTAMVITHFYVKEDDPHPKEHAILILLKVNQTLSFFMFVYVLGRLVFEPVSIRKPRTRQPTVIPGAAGAKTAAEPLKPLEVPESCEECAICVEHWANRQLGCGHLVCCCCLGEIWKGDSYLSSRCPFCRHDITWIRKLKLADGGETTIRDCCTGEIAIPSTTSSLHEAEMIL